MRRLMSVNRQIRLDLTKTRLTEQKTNFTDLKSQNEDIDLDGDCCYIYISTACISGSIISCEQGCPADTA